MSKKLDNFNAVYDYYMSRLDKDNGAICFDDRELTYGDMRHMVDSYVCHLKELGVKKGMGVGYSTVNCPEDFALFFAICRIGAYCIPLFHMIPDKVKASTFKAGKAVLVITSANLYAPLKAASEEISANYKFALIDSPDGPVYSMANEPPTTEDSSPTQTEPDLPALMTTSSGTTGIPKLVMMNQQNIASVMTISGELVEPVDRYGKKPLSTLMAFPYSTSAILVASGIFFTGARSIFTSEINPAKYMELAVRWKAENISAPPAFFEAILNLPNLDSFERKYVRSIATGMDFFSPRLLARLREKFPAIDSFANGYGLTETATVFMVMRILNQENLDGPTNILALSSSVENGISIRDEEGNEVSDGTEGELWVKGPSVIKGYLDNKEETAKAFSDGWFKTGDNAKKTGEREVVLLGRNKYLIKRGGKSISPLVVESCINQVGGVQDSAVVGVKHPLFGEMIWAFVSETTRSPEREKNIMKHCRQELPNYMTPDRIQFISQIPKNPGVGKVNYEKLIQMAEEDLKAIGV
ncbi:MAG: class I adenylate-forming enzyme family protein [Spirochaetales bacterium]|nr:class I adenylate-forming enzyme family protein [Spirochaetales bacterium]